MENLEIISRDLKKASTLLQNLSDHLKTTNEFSKENTEWNRRYVNSIVQYIPSEKKHIIEILNATINLVESIEIEPMKK
jgi:hypothetical protein